MPYRKQNDLIDRLRWQHRNAAEVKDFAQNPEQLERFVKVKAVFERSLF